MQEPLILEEAAMGQEDRIKGLETITKTLGERLDSVDEKLKNLLKSSEDSKSPHWAVSILIALVLGWMGRLSVQVINHGNKLTGIGAILSPQETLKSLTSAVSPDPQKAKKELAQVTDSFQKLGRAKVNLPEQTVSDTSEQLIALSNTHKDLPETWTAIGAFITYRSQMIRGWQETNLPLCTAQFHKFKLLGKIGETKDTTTFEHGPVEIHDCKIILDSPETTAELSPDLSMADVVFTHCAVFYNGGPIILVPVKVARDMPPTLVGHMTFTDCLFIVSLSGVPAPHGTDFARALLSSPDENLILAPPS
jgi:hypothetical protein